MILQRAEDLLAKADLKAEILSQKADEANANAEQLAAKNDYSSDEYVNSLRELSKWNDTLEKRNQLEQAVSAYTQAQEMLRDKDLKDLAEEEIKIQEEQIEKLIAELEIITAKPMPNDNKKALLEIRPGVGGVEASLFAEDLYRMYIRYCNSKSYSVEQYSLEYDTEKGIKEAVFLINEPGSFGTFRFESGVHRVQRVPTTESAGRIHTSTASVVVLPKIDSVDIQIKSEELRIDVYRSSGPGGQSVNTTDSAVRITHIPTGITVSCQNGKSQHKNKEMAMSILLSKLHEIEVEKKEKELSGIRNTAIMGGDRSAKIRTYNFPQGRITDHRVGQTWHNIMTAMEGDIDEIITTVGKDIRLMANE